MAVTPRPVGERSPNPALAWGRFAAYPLYLWRHVAQADIYHVVDQTYSHLVNHLPGHRTVVTCHDLDAFRSLAAREEERRSPFFRAGTRWILRGLRRAARVVCDSEATRVQAEALPGLDPARLHVVPLGLGHTFFAERPDPKLSSSILLHVGNTSPRKRIDVLLRVLAAVRPVRREVRLLRVGGPLPSEQRQLARELGIADAVEELPPLSDADLAALYRQATLVLLPSEREGFGLPLAESLACGTPVVASDLPVLREVGGPAAVYAPAGNVDAWARTVLGLLEQREHDPAGWAARCDEGRRWARRYDWQRTAAAYAEIYAEVAAEAQCREQLR